ncbi:hypothetical protein NH340_JMT03879 [Sarcoptes scabiei]|uniref:Uncharacterized protein n=1 Tax=Sarcoptes scabiei TaxID=52283 RepID=A0A131ZXB0_SARSC|nr:hypothetical protein QR98_0011690 [Sarcoptes scabiei]UXI17935.1 hypothetical protein NH340_JMT03879 [Sarcoptes scabiei]
MIAYMDEKLIIQNQDDMLLEYPLSDFIDPEKNFQTIMDPTTSVRIELFEKKYQWITNSRSYQEKNLNVGYSFYACGQHRIVYEKLRSHDLKAYHFLIDEKIEEQRMELMPRKDGFVLSNYRDDSVLVIGIRRNIVTRVITLQVIFVKDCKSNHGFRYIRFDRDLCWENFNESIIRLKTKCSSDEDSLKLEVKHGFLTKFWMYLIGEDRIYYVRRNPLLKYQRVKLHQKPLSKFFRCPKIVVLQKHQASSNSSSSSSTSITSLIANQINQQTERPASMKWSNWIFLMLLISITFLLMVICILLILKLRQQRMKLNKLKENRLNQNSAKMQSPRSFETDANKGLWTSSTKTAAPTATIKKMSSVPDRTVFRSDSLTTSSPVIPPPPSSLDAKKKSTVFQPLKSSDDSKLQAQMAKSSSQFWSELKKS